MTDQLDRLIKALADRYTIERELGAGGMATVYLAEDVKHHRKVAVKILRPELASVIGPERFLREIETTARLTHPHILPLYDSGEADGFLYYVMPYVEGESLRERLRREKQLPQEDAVRIAQEVADALGSAHRRDVLHRDIKPENILLEEDHAVVADFGIATAISLAGGDRLTETGLAVGTPIYMSPEQAAGDRDLDGRSDIYGLACVLHEMLTGQPPFTGPTGESIVHQHLTADAPSITTIRPAVSVDVAATVQRALAKAPADRYRTCSEFAEALTAATAAKAPRTPVTHGRARTWGVRGTVIVGAVLALILGLRLLRTPAPAIGSDRPNLVVLPFTNLGAPVDEYFADGITEEVTSRLVRMSGLVVIGRTSANRYKNSDRTAREIGDELGVDYLLEGSVRWSRAATDEDRVRVSPQLIRVSDESYVWSEPYESDLADIFAVQVNIAERVAQALDIALLRSEQEAINVRPTDNLDAYDLFLQANSYFYRPISEENQRNAQALYERALQADPNFALAAARLSMVHSFMYWYYWDRSENRLAQARRVADLALRIAPELPEVHRALGEFHYRARLNYELALEEFSIAGQARRDDAEIHLGIGSVQRRQGRWEEAAQNIARASELEPASASHAVQTGITYLYMRDYSQAESHFRRAGTLAPDEIRPPIWLGRLHLARDGDTTAVRSLLVQAEQASARELDPQSWWHWAMYRILDGASAANFDRLNTLQADSAFRYVAMAELHGLRNDPSTLRAYYDSARTVLEARVAAQPDEARFHSELGLAYAGLGRARDAIEAGQRAVELLPTSKEALFGADWARNLAQIYTMVGDYDAAVDELENLLSINAAICGHWLQLDPIWGPLHSNSRFRALIDRYPG